MNIAFLQTFFSCLVLVKPGYFQTGLESRSDKASISHIYFYIFKTLQSNLWVVYKFLGIRSTKFRMKKNIYS